LRAKDLIIALAKDSKHATATASKAPNNNKEDNKIKAFNTYLIDNYKSINRRYIF
jgi:hypothetical protein